MKQIGIVLICLFLSGCIGATNLKANLEKQHGELAYLHDTQKVPPKECTLTVKSFVVDDILPSSINVEKTAGYAVPLLFINIWKEQYQCSLGSQQIANNFKQFIQDSVVEELKRSGCCNYTMGKGDLDLDVHVNKLEMKAPVNGNGFFLFLLFLWSFHSQTSAGPVEISMQADVALRRNGDTVFHKNFVGKYITKSIQSKYSSRDKLLEEYTLTMIEGLSFAIKDLSEKIVKEINQTI